LFSDVFAGVYTFLNYAVAESIILISPLYIATKISEPSGVN